jgi:diguanylate cyclase (GGDEF)-like protein
LRQEWDRAVRYRSALALLLTDINGPKQVNDALGHSGGDDLRRAGAAIRASLRGSDIGARWGGDEFAIAFQYRYDGSRFVILRVFHGRESR